MDAEQAKAKLLAVEKELGHAIRVFTNAASSAKPDEVSPSSTEEPDEFYEFTPDDYYRIMSDRIGAQSQILKTRKMREADAAALKAKITKAVIRVHFPDNYILEAKFQPTETLQSLMDLLKKAVAHPDLPFYIYTTPPKEHVKDTSKDFYTAGFAPGAIVYFSYDLPKDLDSDNSKGPYLRDDIISLNGLDLTTEQADPVHPEEPKVVQIPSPVLDSRPPAKKPTKPKWLKL
ncbi:plant UBX domain-containing protein 1-like [Zingiber officinale]|uniref:plant UBX domain-containing protein 1-like n=1 Tax=Zingiber officinale TaxID=94328 RepID=UPI001C4C755F|nr:plant UBX domain-containing protein 1-like [Zingiber officinale]